jgi:16S rRNA processing protein RimM
LFEVSRVWLESDRGRHSFAVEGVRPATKGVLVKLRGVDDRDAADGLRDARISAERDQLQPLAEDEFYLTDVVGAVVTAPDGSVGIVHSVEVHPSVDCLLIRTETGEFLQQPLVEAFIESIDVEGGCVVLRNREGLF